ncbi:MAG: hypothetical protein Q9181_002771 [Wetmoreana brouardii]
MSIDLDWEGLTTGPEGHALAKSIKDFIHEKFQRVQLPRFIRSVEVHAFDFGKECPVVDLKDICDPLSEFYEADDEDDSEDGGGEEVATEHDTSTADLNSGAGRQSPITRHGSKPSMSQAFNRPLPIDTRFATHRPDLSRSSTPGIPGGTSNLSYFHLPLSAGLSGTQTPLAAVASGSALSAGWSDTHLAGPFAHLHQRSPVRQEQQPQPSLHYADPSSRPSTSDSFAQPFGNMNDEVSQEAETEQGRRVEPDPSDVQIVLHISYTGSVHLSITAEILLDYPMPSFVGIPLQLNITGLSFDGVALIAYLRKKAHFCFLGPEDARTLVGSEYVAHPNSGVDEKKDGIGGLLREIQVESEIGRQEGGKQVLRNVGKVEKFVLEQMTEPSDENEQGDAADVVSQTTLPNSALYNLPNELILEIGSHLPIHCRLALTRTCHHFRDLFANGPGEFIVRNILHIDLYGSGDTGLSSLGQYTYERDMFLSLIEHDEIHYPYSIDRHIRGKRGIWSLFAKLREPKTEKQIWCSYCND